MRPLPGALPADDERAHCAENGADQQHQTRDPAHQETRVAPLGRLHVALEIQRPPDDEEHPEACRDVGIQVVRKEHDRGQEDHQLLEGVHVHAEVALELRVAGGRRRRHVVARAGARHGRAEHEKLDQGESDHQVNVRHETPSGFFTAEWHNAFMSDKERGYAHRVDVRAGAELVWRALTETAQLTQWCSPQAEIRPRQGGHFRASVDRVTEFEAHIDVFEPARRLRLIYLPHRELSPAQTVMVDDFILEPTAGGTIVRLLGSGVPAGPEWDTQYRRLRTSWQQAMTRLKVFVELQARAGAPP